MSILTAIESEIAELPPHLRAEVLDFVHFVKQRHGLPTTPKPEVTALSNTEDSPLYQALSKAGLIGCVETDAQLATTYKSQLDFSAKYQTQP